MKKTISVILTLAIIAFSGSALAKSDRKGGKHKKETITKAQFMEKAA
jgi:hypothetical protein